MGAGQYTKAVPLTSKIHLKGSRGEDWLASLEGFNHLRFAHRLAAIPPLPWGEGGVRGKRPRRPEGIKNEMHSQPVSPGGQMSFWPYHIRTSTVRRWMA